MTTTDHPSGLPKQEPTSHTVAVLCDGGAWAKTGADWESLSHFCSWGGLRNLAAERGGAALFDLADLPTGLTEVQKEAVRSIEGKFLARGGISTEIRMAFPEVFADDRVAATWKSGDSDEKLAELLRVVRMEGAHVVATRGGVTRSGNVHHVERSFHIHLGDAITEAIVDLSLSGSTIAATAPKPKPVDPTGGDPVVRASIVTFVVAKKCIFFRARDGRWSRACDSERGTWGTAELAEIERLSAQTIAELMGGAS